MFFRTSGTPEREYLQLAESYRESGRARQRVIATLGRLEEVRASGELDRLLRSGVRFSQGLRVTEKPVEPNGESSELSPREKLLHAMSEESPRNALIALLHRLISEDQIRSARVYPGMEAAPPDATVTEGSRFVLPLAGAYRFILNPQDRRQDLTVPVGQFCWIRGGDRIVACNDTARTMLTVTFSSKFTRFLWYHHPGDGSHFTPPKLSIVFHTSTAMSPGLRHQVEAMTEAVALNYEDVFRGNAQALLAWCLRELRLDSGQTLSAGRLRYFQVSAYVAGHLSGDLSRQAVASHFGMSVNSLSRLFQTQAKSGFNDYVRRERVELAAKLLRSGHLSVKEVAGFCGFNLTAYFIKCFREAYGMTPTQYRRGHRLTSAATEPLSPL